MGLFAGLIAQKAMMAMGTFSNRNTFLSLRTLFLSSATHASAKKSISSRIRILLRGLLAHGSDVMDI